MTSGDDISEYGDGFPSWSIIDHAGLLSDLRAAPRSDGRA
jgi:hypothetical protein